MKKILSIVLLLAIIGGAVGYYMYNKAPDNVLSLKTDYKLNASDLFSAFETDENTANGKFLDKVVEITGKVISVKNEEGKTSGTIDGGGMMFGVICELDPMADHKRVNFEEGEEVKFKGICTGMLMDVVLVRCVEQ